MMHLLKLPIMACFMLLATNGHAQNKGKELTNRVNLAFGIGQLAINGFNIEGNLFYKRFVFDYSHGVSLNLSNDQLKGPDKEQGLAIHIPYSTGFGVGYRLNEWLNIRLEPKWHRYELYYDGQAQTTTNRITAYNTFTLGIGTYANIRPFKKRDNFLKGIMIIPNARWWPKIATTLENDEYIYYNSLTEKTETHKARNIGLRNTPFFFNFSIGYSLTLK